VSKFRRNINVSVFLTHIFYSAHYKFYNNKLYFTHNPKLKDYYLIIPKPEERDLLVDETNQ
jgi:hypothetical protein